MKVKEAVAATAEQSKHHQSSIQFMKDASQLRLVPLLPSWAACSIACRTVLETRKRTILIFFFLETLDQQMFRETYFFELIPCPGYLPKTDYSTILLLAAVLPPILGLRIQWLLALL
jgi:hypothetical protein